MSVPTTGEKFSELIEHLTKACEAAYTIAHLYNAMDGSAISKLYAGAYLNIGQNLERARDYIVHLSKGSLN